MSEIVVVDDNENDNVTVVTVDDEPEVVEPEQPDPTVVVIETDNDIPIEPLIDHAERIALLERENEELRLQIQNADAKAFVAQVTADDALDVALDVAEESAETDAEIIEAVDETVEDIVDEVNEDDGGILSEDEPIDVAPASARVHPIFRPWSDWRGSRS